jgi:uncharacterized DUF497 family protein
MLYIHQLIWDNWNIAHIARHQVVPEEVEQVCHGQPLLWQAKVRKGRVFIIGPTSSGRMLVVVLDEEGTGIYYVVTARPADRAERRIYQRQKGDE